MTAELKNACSAIEAHVAKRTLIDEKLALAQENRKELTGEEANARARLSQAEAESALEDDPKKAAEARRALLELRDSIEINTARIEGLKNLAIAHDAELATLSRTLRAAVHAEYRSALVPLARRFREGAQILGGVVLEVEAIESAFGINSPYTEGIKKALTLAIKDVETGEPIVHLLQSRDRIPWREDSAALKLWEQLEPVTAALAALRKEEYAIRSREEVRRREERDARRQAEPATAAAR